jgi:phosphopantetheinyl transferase (holo-ACP synthase)
MERLAIDRWHVTLSDEREFAVAFVVLERSRA